MIAVGVTKMGKRLLLILIFLASGSTVKSSLLGVLTNPDDPKSSIRQLLTNLNKRLPRMQQIDLGRLEVVLIAKIFLDFVEWFFTGREKLFEDEDLKREIKTSVKLIKQALAPYVEEQKTDEGFKRALFGTPKPAVLKRRRAVSEVELEVSQIQLPPAGSLKKPLVESPGGVTDLVLSSDEPFVVPALELPDAAQIQACAGGRRVLLNEILGIWVFVPEV